MKKIISLSILQLVCFLAIGQTKILPGDKSINKALIKQGKFTMAYYSVDNGSYTEIATYKRDVQLNNGKFILKTNLSLLNSNIEWKETSVAEENSLKPISRKSERDTRTYSLNFLEKVTGDYVDTKTGNKTSVIEETNEGYFDISCYPYLLSALPLKTGYKAVIPVYDYEAKAKSKINNVLVLEVKSAVFNSSLTGNHNVWEVSAAEEGSGNVFIYYIDKDDRKLWQAKIKADGRFFALVDKETEVNPFKNEFNKAETFKMVSEGGSTIAGEAYARDDRTRKDNGKEKFGASINFSKKQFAPKGTNVLLMPYTAYYREWFEINKKQAKIKGAKPIPLPKDALECLKYTQVYDDKGHFEFTNLMPGEYLLYITFDYEDFFTRTEETGRANVYVNGHYAGTEVYTGMFGYTTAGGANIQKNVTVKENNKTVKVKLKEI